MVCLAYLWRRDQEELLQEMIEARVKAVIIKVASMGRSRLPCFVPFLCECAFFAVPASMLCRSDSG